MLHAWVKEEDAMLRNRLSIHFSTRHLDLDRSKKCAAIGKAEFLQEVILQHIFNIWLKVCWKFCASFWLWSSCFFFIQIWFPSCNDVRVSRQARAVNVSQDQQQAHRGMAQCHASPWQFVIVSYAATISLLSPLSDLRYSVARSRVE